MTAWSYFNNAVRRASGVSDFNFHDLRRTFMTLISEKTNFIESHLDGLLNHKQSETRSALKSGDGKRQLWRIRCQTAFELLNLRQQSS